MLKKILPSFYILSLLFLLFPLQELKAENKNKLICVAEPVFHTSEELDFLKQGIKAILSSKIERRGMLAQKAEEAKFEIQSTVTAFGGTMALDLSLTDKTQGKLIFSEQKISKDEGEVLPEISAFADQVIAYVGEDKKEMPPIVKESSFKRESYETKKILTDKIEKRIKGAIVSMDKGDLCADSKIKIVMATRNKLEVYSEDLKEIIATFSLPHYEHILRLDVLDTDLDSRAEIWLSAYNPETERMRSRVLVMENKKLKEIIKGENRVFVKNRDKNGNYIILSQARSFREGLFSGEIMKTDLKEGRLIFHKDKESFISLFKDFPVYARKKENMDVFSMDLKGKLSLSSPEEDLLWEEKGEVYNKLPVFMDYSEKNQQRDNPPERFYFSAKPLIITAKNGKEEVLLTNNKELTGSLLQRVRIFQTSNLDLLSWNGHTMEITAKTQNFDGYIADFLYLPEKNKLILALVKGGGNFSLSPETHIISCFLPE